MSAVPLKMTSIKVAGILLMIIGAGLAAAVYFFNELISLVGISIAMIILGFSGIVLSNGGSRVSSDVYQLNKTKTHFFIALALVLCAVNVLVVFLSSNNLEIYFVVDAISFLIISLAFVNLDRRSKVGLNIIGAILFVTFIAIIVFKIIRML